MFSSLVLLPQVKKASSCHISIRDVDTKRSPHPYPGEALVGTTISYFCSLVTLTEKIFQQVERPRTWLGRKRWMSRVEEENNLSTFFRTQDGAVSLFYQHSLWLLEHIKVALQ